jgi:hypothetical protein
LTEGEVLTAGSLKRVTCTSVAGNPLATLKWFMGDRQLRSFTVTKDNYASAELELVPQRTDNGQELRCEASSIALETPLAATVAVAVQFAPDYVKVALAPETPRSGDNVTLTCETASSRPSAGVTWWHNGERLRGATERVAESGEADGGSITTSTLLLTLTAQHHGAVVTCEAGNPAVERRVHDAITLSVHRK